MSDVSCLFSQSEEYDEDEEDYDYDGEDYPDEDEDDDDYGLVYKPKAQQAQQSQRRHGSQYWITGDSLQVVQPQSTEETLVEGFSALAVGKLMK